MHEHAQPRASHPRSTARELLLSVNGPGRPGGRLLGHSPVYCRPAGRPLFPTVGNPTVGGRPGGRPTAESSPELSRTASFWSLFIWGCFGLFEIRFEVGFQASFFYLSKCLSPLVLKQILPYRKESFQE